MKKITVVLMLALMFCGVAHAFEIGDIVTPIDGSYVLQDCYVVGSNEIIHRKVDGRNIVGRRFWVRGTDRCLPADCGSLTCQLDAPCETNNTIISSGDETYYIKAKYLKEYHRLLTLFLGTPVSHFDWTYADKDDKYITKTGLSPKEFYQLGDWKVSDFVTLTNDPRNEMDVKMSMDYLGNMEGTSNVVYYNTTIEELDKWSEKAILEGVPVWYGCDVKKWMDGEKDAMDLSLVDYSVLDVDFTLTKRERMEYGISCPTHAMTLVGFESEDVGEKIGQKRKWKVENSWDSKGANSGYYMMTHDWFKQYVYEVVIPRWVVDEETLKKIDECKKFVDLPPWDVMAKEKL